MNNMEQNNNDDGNLEIPSDYGSDAWYYWTNYSSQGTLPGQTQFQFPTSEPQVLQTTIPSFPQIPALQLPQAAPYQSLQSNGGQFFQSAVPQFQSPTAFPPSIQASTQPFPQAAIPLFPEASMSTSSQATCTPPPLGSKLNPVFINDDDDADIDAVFTEPSITTSNTELSNLDNQIEKVCLPCISDPSPDVLMVVAKSKTSCGEKRKNPPEPSINHDRTPEFQEGSRSGISTTPSSSSKSSAHAKVPQTTPRKRARTIPVPKNTPAPQSPPAITATSPHVTRKTRVPQRPITKVQVAARRSIAEANSYLNAMGMNQGGKVLQWLQQITDTQSEAAYARTVATSTTSLQSAVAGDDNTQAIQPVPISKRGSRKERTEEEKEAARKLKNVKQKEYRARKKAEARASLASARVENKATVNTTTATPTRTTPVRVTSAAMKPPVDESAKIAHKDPELQEHSSLMVEGGFSAKGDDELELEDLAKAMEEALQKQDAEDIELENLAKAMEDALENDSQSACADQDEHDGDIDSLFGDDPEE